MARYFHIITMGCQMNAYDSDHLGQALLNYDYFPTPNPKKADFILINTCTVRAKAEHKAYSLLGRMVSLKRRRPALILGITGCIAQQEGPALMKRFPELDLVLGTREIGRIGELLEGLQARREKIVATDMDLGPLKPAFTHGYFKGRVKGYISIMEGCDNYCSYCIVPYVRGREVSRPPDEILREADRLVSQGIKEITLLGQNVNSYGWEGGGRKGVNFPSLLRDLSRLNGLLRMRFTTSHPKDLSDELIQCFGKHNRLCPHIHLPFQAGSNKVLRLMHRGYTREEYIGLINKLRQVRPEIAITSDVMVGFPQESEEDFEMTLDLIRKIKFDSLYSFKYSDRKGTPAEKMPGKVGEETKSRRLEILQRLQREITLKKNRLLRGREIEVLVEGESKRGGQFTGRTDTNKVVNFPFNNNKIGSLVKVKIKRIFVNSLWGEVIDSGG